MSVQHSANLRKSNIEHSTSNIECSIIEQCDDDDLPRPGKVWDSSGPSLAELLKQHESSEPTPVESIGEPALADGIVRIRIDRSTQTRSQRRTRRPTDLPEPGNACSTCSPERPGHPVAPFSWRAQKHRGGKATIQFSSPTFAAMLDRNGKKDVIRDELSKLLEQPVGVAIEVSEVEEAVVAPVAPRPQLRCHRERRLAQNQPVMQSVPVSTGIRITPGVEGIAS